VRIIFNSRIKHIHINLLLKKDVIFQQIPIIPDSKGVSTEYEGPVNFVAINFIRENH